MLIYLVPMSALLAGQFLYLDPGTGSMLLQMALAAILGLAVLVRMQWTRIKKLFGKKNEVTDEEDEKDE
jgi:hypothetical protein